MWYYLSDDEKLTKKTIPCVWGDKKLINGENLSNEFSTIYYKFIYLVVSIPEGYFDKRYLKEIRLGEMFESISPISIVKFNMRQCMSIYLAAYINDKLSDIIPVMDKKIYICPNILLNFFKKDDILGCMKKLYENNIITEFECRSSDIEFICDNNHYEFLDYFKENIKKCHYLSDTLISCIFKNGNIKIIKWTQENGFKIPGRTGSDAYNFFHYILIDVNGKYIFNDTNINYNFQNDMWKSDHYFTAVKDPNYITDILENAKYLQEVIIPTRNLKCNTRLTNGYQKNIIDTTLLKPTDTKYSLIDYNFVKKFGLNTNQVFVGFYCISGNYDLIDKIIDENTDDENKKLFESDYIVNKCFMNAWKTNNTYLLDMLSEYIKKNMSYNSYKYLNNYAINSIKHKSTMTLSWLTKNFDFEISYETESIDDLNWCRSLANNISIKKIICDISFGPTNNYVNDKNDNDDDNVIVDNNDDIDDNIEVTDDNVLIINDNKINNNWRIPFFKWSN